MPAVNVQPVPMPNAPRSRSLLVLLFVLLTATPFGLGAQQRDSAAVRDSVRRDSIARADSVRADSIRRSELARIRAEPRAVERPEASAGVVGDARMSADSARRAQRVMITAASAAGDMRLDLSPDAAARPRGSRMGVHDVEGALAARYGEHARGLFTLTLTDDGSAQRLTATDAAVFIALPVARTELIVGHTALPFGRAAQLHRHELALPDEPLPIRVLLGENGLRGTGVQLRSGRALGGAQVTLDLALADRFGARVDSLHPGEPTDQSLAGLAAGGRLGARFRALGARVDAGVSSITGKREQPIGCVYEGTVGPVPCPEAVNAANTRLTVLGADARAGWGRGGNRLVLSGEWLHLVVGPTDLPVFSNDRFAPFYKGLSGTYDGAFVVAHVRATEMIGIGARAEWLQNPEVDGLNDAWAGGYVDFWPAFGTRLTASYQRRLPSSSALAAMSTEDRNARDRIVLRGTVVIGRHPRAGRD